MKEDKYKNILVALLPDGNNVKKGFYSAKV